MYFRDSNPSKIGLGYLESSLHEYSKTKHEYPAFKKEKTTGEFSQSSILLYPPPGKINTAGFKSLFHLSVSF